MEANRLGNYFDTVHIHIDDLADLERNVRLAKNLGFQGMLVLLPKEIPLSASILLAHGEGGRGTREMLRLYGEAQRQSKGVAVMNGRFIGPPLVIAAKKTIARRRLVAGTPQ